MENETYASNGFKIEDCRARARSANYFVDCLSPKQAILCDSSTPFDSGFFCHHLNRNEIIEHTKKLKIELHPPSGVSQSDNMKNDSHTGKSFKIENCRAENSVKDWVDCLSPEQACICGFSVSCGNGYSCEHPRRFGLVEITKKLKSKLVPPPNVLQSDNQE